MMRTPLLMNLILLPLALLAGPDLSLASADQASTPALADVFPAQPGLQDYLDWSAAHSPRLAGQAARAKALRAQAARAGALPGLKLAWGEMLVPVETRVGPQERVFSLSQSLPWFGTLGAREAGLAAEAAAADETLREQQWQVAHEVRATWYELAFLSRQAEIVARNLGLARQTEAHARTRYETGEVSYGAVLEAQMEIGRLEARLTGIRDRTIPVTARLNTAAGLAPGTPTPEGPDLPADLVDAILPAQAALQTALRLGNPSLASLRHMEESRRQGVVAAGKSSYPDLTIGLDYIMTGEAAMPDVTDSGKDPVIARVAVNIPLWGGQAGAEQKASVGMLRAASAGLSDTRLQLEAGLENILYAWREAGRNVELYGTTLLPRSGQNLQVVTASYESGQADFARLLAARQSHLGLELALLRARTDRVLALNDLGALLGVTPEDLARGILPGVAAPVRESE